MKSRRLGKWGLEVPRLCLGTMTFGLQVDEPGSVSILDTALAQGLNFLDTADAYPLGGTLETIGDTERIIGRWMQQRGNRKELILASKCWAPTHRGLNAFGLSRQHILDAIDASLDRLQTDYIDLYQAHAYDPRIPIEETLRTFDELVTSGRVRYVGCSNYPAWRLGAALSAADRLNITGYVSVQPRYNLLYREIETELLPLCRSAGLGVLVYNPLAGGFLSGKYDRQAGLQQHTRFTLGTAAERYQQRYWQDAQFDAVTTLKRSVDQRGLDMVTVSLAWVLKQPDITAAIIGASRPQQLHASLAALELELDEELLAACDAAWWQLPRRPVIEGYR